MSDRLIGGRYRLLGVLAAGGFGEVWRARDERLHVDVAIKRIKIDPDASRAERAKLVARAEQEARNAAALRDEPNVVAVHDVVTEDGLPWVVMRFVNGRSVAQELAGNGRIQPARAAEIALGVLKALKAAHAAGIVHRDVKPANIMLAADGQVLLADFGIAKHRADTALTSTGMLIGSLEYMAPERFGADPSANGATGDLFSVGATLFEMVEGSSPFRRDSVMATMAAVAFEPHPPLRNAGPLTPLIESLLAKKPADRPSVDEAIALLTAPPPTPRPTPPRTPPRAAKMHSTGPSTWSTETLKATNAASATNPAKASMPPSAPQPAAKNPVANNPVAKSPVAKKQPAYSAMSITNVPAYLALIGVAIAAYVCANFFPIMSERWTDKASGTEVGSVVETFDLLHPITRQEPVGGTAASDWPAVAVLGIGTAILLALALFLPLWDLEKKDERLNAGFTYVVGWTWLFVVALITVAGPLPTDLFKVTDSNNSSLYLHSVIQPGGWLMLLANAVVARAWSTNHKKPKALT